MFKLFVVPLHFFIFYLNTASFGVSEHYAGFIKIVKKPFLLRYLYRLSSTGIKSIRRTYSAAGSMPEMCT